MADNNLTREGSDNFNKYNPTVSGDAAWQAKEAQLEAQSRAGKSPNPYNPGASAPLSSKVMSNTLDASDFGTQGAVRRSDGDRVCHECPPNPTLRVGSMKSAITASGTTLSAKPGSWSSNERNSFARHSFSICRRDDDGRACRREYRRITGHASRREPDDTGVLSVRRSSLLPGSCRSVSGRSGDAPT